MVRKFLVIVLFLPNALLYAAGFVLGFIVGQIMMGARDGWWIR